MWSSANLTTSTPHGTLSRLYHAACTLSVYASQPGSPPDHATLDSGWWPALTGQGSHLLGRVEGFRHVYPSTWLSPSPSFAWRNKLLFERPHIAKLLAGRFPEIIVDEAQDTNAWLLILLNFLRDNGAKITLIGDPDQCIFEFSMADATALPNLKTKWSIPEKPLSQSFRCNNQIAAAVRNVGGNAYFTGAGDGASEWHRGFVVKESSKTFSDGLAAFQRLAGEAGVSINSAAIVCRAHGQLESLRGKVNYTNLKGKAKALATAAFLRDSRYDYRGASQTVERIVRELTGGDPLWERIDTDPNSRERMAVALAIWKFVKSPDRLTPVSQLGDTWIPSMRTELTSLIEEIGLQCDAKLGQHIKATGLSAAQKALPLFESVPEFPEVRQDTIRDQGGVPGTKWPTNLSFLVDSWSAQGHNIVRGRYVSAIGLQQQ